MPITRQLSPKIVFLALLGVVLFLLTANVAGIISKFYLGHPYVFGLVSLFNFDTEANVPTIYSALAMLFASMLLLYISGLQKKQRDPSLAWFGLGLIFFYLAIDEAVSIHEHVGLPFERFVDASGLLFFTWVIPYGIALVLLTLIYWKFLMALPRQITRLFITSAVIFVTGAIGFELLGGRQYEVYGADNIGYAIFYTCEELLEMLGVAIFIYALLLYIRRHTGTSIKTAIE